MTGKTRINLAVRRGPQAPVGAGLALLRILAIAIFAAVPVRGQDVRIDREAKIKAAYMFKFISYVEWPAEAFSDDSSALVFGVAGESDVARYMELIARERTVGIRNLMFKHVTDVEHARSCHLLFISERIDQLLLKDLVDDLARSPVLFVGEESQPFTRHDVITFVVQDNRVRLQLSLQAASERNLKISSQLAKLAEVVN